MEVSVVGSSLVGVATGAGPQVLAIPEVGLVFGDGFLGVNLNEVGGVLGVLMEKSHWFAGVSVFEKAVVVDEVVESIT